MVTLLLSNTASVAASRCATSRNLHTQYAGDENCILPPDPEEGLQMHVAPADYDNPDDQPYRSRRADGAPVAGAPRAAGEDRAAAA